MTQEDLRPEAFIVLHSWVVADSEHETGLRQSLESLRLLQGP